ncbi:MAG: hypothetical protein LBN26_04180 [Christensenellaceae bacterium]|jgi:hypothetical protein|nr:hypothetical protein [Christensenellaceae bacterium]
MDDFQKIIKKLQNRGIEFETGLSNQEISVAEELYDFSFPAEMKALFSVALPVTEGFYNWRNFEAANILKIKTAFKMPLRGLLFDLRHNALWCDNWGMRPAENSEVVQIFMRYYKDAPRMIPIYSHRYMPSISNEKKSPVFSIMQSDIICYGTDLIEYLELEFGFKEYSDFDDAEIEHIKFWCDLL